jgi:ABC-2 type transport system ATP-binding protein
MAAYLAEFRSMSKTFAGGFLSRRRTVALRHVSFGLEEGEIFSLIGPNGAGKTTLIRLLLDFIRPTEGCALLFGKPNTIPSLRDAVGYFPERAQYPPRLNVIQFLGYWGRFSGLAGVQLASRTKEVLQLVRLEGKENVPLRDLSKGMAVRVGLSQALINDPRLLILDEPTDGLDPLGRIEFRDILIQLKGRGKTILLNSHLLSEVEQISTRVAILDRGELVALDTLDGISSSQGSAAIQFGCDSPEAVALLGEKYRIDRSGESWILSIKSPNDLDGALKALGRVGATVYSVDRPRSVLEQKFLSLVQPRS